MWLQWTPEWSLVDRVKARLWHNKPEVNLSGSLWLAERIDGILSVTNSMRASSEGSQELERNLSVIENQLIFLPWTSEIIKLLKSKKDPNVADSNWKTALTYGCFHWKTTLVHFLLGISNIRNIRTWGIDYMTWTRNWKWTPQDKERIISMLSSKFNV